MGDDAGSDVSTVDGGDIDEPAGLEQGESTTFIEPELLLEPNEYQLHDK